MVYANIGVGCREVPFRIFVRTCGGTSIFNPISVRAGFSNGLAGDSKIPICIAGGIVKDARLGCEIEFDTRAG